MKGKLFYGVKRKNRHCEEKKREKEGEREWDRGGREGGRKKKWRKGSLRAFHFPNTTGNPSLRLSLTNHGRARRTESRRNRKRGKATCPWIYLPLCVYFSFDSIRPHSLAHYSVCVQQHTDMCVSYTYNNKNVLTCERRYKPGLELWQGGGK